MDNKKTIIVSVAAIIALILITAGATFAFFSAKITGIESASTLSLSAGTLSIKYSEGTGALSASGIYPRGTAASHTDSDAWITKTITLTGSNTTNQTMPYTLGFTITTNGFKTYLSYSLTGTNTGNSGTLISGTNATGGKTGNVPASGSINFGNGSFVNGTDKVHTYVFRLFFLDNSADQNDVQGASFSGKFTLTGGQI